LGVENGAALSDAVQRSSAMQPKTKKRAAVARPRSCITCGRRDFPGAALCNVEIAARITIF
jgi:hypothetical protein